MTLDNCPHMESVAIGAILISQTTMNQVMDELTFDHFTNHDHRVIFAESSRLHKEQRQIDIHTIFVAVKETKRVGTEILQLLERCLSFAEQPHSIDEAIKRLQNQFQLRQFQQLMTDLQKRSHKNDMDNSDLLDLAQSQIFKMASGQQNSTFASVGDSLQGYCEELATRRASGNQICGISTGFNKLDAMTGGFQNQQFIVLGARTSMGKTALALSMAHYMNLDEVHVGFFSLEMPMREINHRLVGIYTGIPVKALMQGFIGTQEDYRVRNCIDDLKQHHLYIDDTANCTLQMLRTKARQMVQKHGVQIIIIDYLQLITPTGKLDQRYQEVGEISRGLKNLAKELNVPILCLAQLSRRVDERNDHTPMPADLRESGSIEQDADLILLLKRDHVYDRRKDPKNADLYLAKNRNGETGKIEIEYHGPSTKFCDQEINVAELMQS